MEADAVVIGANVDYRQNTLTEPGPPEEVCDAGQMRVGDRRRGGGGESVVAEIRHTRLGGSATTRRATTRSQDERNRRDDDEPRLHHGDCAPPTAR